MSTTLPASRDLLKGVFVISVIILAGHAGCQGEFDVYQQEKLVSRPVILPLALIEKIPEYRTCHNKGQCYNDDTGN
jgi:hypothetical protein